MLFNINTKVDCEQKRKDSEKSEIVTPFNASKQEVPIMSRGDTGFTLAEILITLGVIGVVAAMTIPTLVKNYQDLQYKTAYKKAYAVLNQAVLSAIANDEFVDSPASTPNPNGFETNFLTIMSKFKTTKQCIGGGTNPQCWNSNGEKYGLNYSAGFPNSAAYAFIDSSGMAWSMYYSSALRLFVDTNGFKEPNQWGKDRFGFYVLDSKNVDEGSMGIPAKVKPFEDNALNVCSGTNACATVGNQDYQKFYSTSWLYK